MDGVLVFLGVGSNCGQKECAVREAIAWLGNILLDACSSDVYETLPVGHAGDNYMNAVVAGYSKETVEQLNSRCKAYELAHGRDDEARRLNRVPIDIDIVVAGGNVLRKRDFSNCFFRKGYDEILSVMPVQYLEALR